MSVLALISTCCRISFAFTFPLYVPCFNLFQYALAKSICNLFGLSIKQKKTPMHSTPRPATQLKNVKQQQQLYAKRKSNITFESKECPETT